MKGIIIQGSSRNDGDTNRVVKILKENSGWDLVDLNDYEFSYYDYAHENAGDDFIPLMKRAVENYDTIIFATPVYWYSMSGILKVFFDRITDLLEIEKDLGRNLRGMNMAAISCSIGNNLGEFFWLPFSKTAEYLGMNYLGNVHTVINEEYFSGEQDILDFINRVEEMSEQSN